MLAGVAGMLALGALLAGLWAGGVFSPAGRPGRNREVRASFTNTVGMELVLIPAGKFHVVSLADEVELTRPFYMGKHEVTQRQFKDVMGYNPSYFSADDRTDGVRNMGKDWVKGLDTSDFPVECVNWFDAVEFCRRLTEKERTEEKIGGEQEYRLPSEAQWEYSCRGGSVSKPFHFGDSLSSVQANFDGNFPYGGAAKGPYLQRTAKVGSYQANAFGLYDMHGNVNEWCADGYDEDAYKARARRDPLVLPKEQGSDRVYRGGGWSLGGQFCRSEHRHGTMPTYRGVHVGFRVALVSPGGSGG